MDVDITGRHVEVTAPMEAHIRQHIDKLPRYDDRILYVNVTLNMESGSQRCEVMVKCHRADLVAEASSRDMYQSIEEAFGKMERQITRFHDKLVRNRARAGKHASQDDRRPV